MSAFWIIMGGPIFAIIALLGTGLWVVWDLERKHSRK